MNKLNRRDFLLMSAASAASAALAACAPKATLQPAAEVQATPEAATEVPAKPTAQATPQPVTVAPEEEGTLIRFWAGWGNSGFVDGVNMIVESEQGQHALGSNTFELTAAVPGEKILAAIASGDPPEAGENINYLDYMARGACEPIEALVATSEAYKDDRFFPGIMDSCRYQGHTYGVPNIEGFLRFGLDYNSKLVEEAGLDPDSPPVTWAECYQWHQKLTKFDDAGNLLQIGLNPYDAMGEGVWFDGWMVPESWGFKWFDPDSGEFNVDNEAMVESFATFKEFVDLVGVDNLAGMYSVEGHGTWGGAYNAEVQAMIIEGYWHPGETMSEAPEVAQYNRATWLPVPESRRGVKTQGETSHMTLFFAGAKNTEGMFRISELFVSQMGMDAFFNNVGWLPAVKSYIASLDGSKYPGLQFYLDCVDEVTEWWGTPFCPIVDFVDSEYASMYDRVDRGEVTPEEAAAELQKRYTDEYEAAGFAG